MDYTFLPDDEKLLRLQECDFFLKDSWEEQKKELAGTLKDINNPILILFYYNDTEKDVFSDWFYASRSEKYQMGLKKDFVNVKGIEDEDLEFKFGAVNLDYEKKLDEAFARISKNSPFYWMKTNSEYYYPFILFYYKTIPHMSYEGVLNSYVITHEFSNWREDFTDIDDTRTKKALREDLIITKDKYYEAVKDDLFFGINLEKGKMYKITIN